MLKDWDSFLQHKLRTSDHRDSRMNGRESLMDHRDSLMEQLHSIKERRESIIDNRDLILDRCDSLRDHRDSLLDHRDSLLDHPSDSFLDHPSDSFLDPTSDIYLDCRGSSLVGDARDSFDYSAMRCAAAPAGQQQQQVVTFQENVDTVQEIQRYILHAPPSSLPLSRQHSAAAAAEEEAKRKDSRMLTATFSLTVVLIFGVIVFSIWLSVEVGMNGRRVWRSGRKESKNT